MRGLDTHDRAVVALAACLATRTRRQLADRELHLGYIDLAGALKSIRRGVAVQDEHVIELLDEMTTTVRRGLADAETRLAHVGELIAARDVRRLVFLAMSDARMPRELPSGSG